MIFSFLFLFLFCREVFALHASKECTVSRSRREIGENLKESLASAIVSSRSFSLCSRILPAHSYVTSYSCNLSSAIYDALLVINNLKIIYFYILNRFSLRSSFFFFDILLAVRPHIHVTHARTREKV